MLATAAIGAYDDTLSLVGSRDGGLSGRTKFAMLGVVALVSAVLMWDDVHGLGVDYLFVPGIRERLAIGWLMVPLACLAIMGSAAVCGARGAHRRAVRLLGAATSIGDAWWPVILFENTPDDQVALAKARAVLGEDAFAREWAAGQSLTLEQAIAEALEVNTVPT